MKIDADHDVKEVEDAATTTANTTDHLLGTMAINELWIHRTTR